MSISLQSGSDILREVLQVIVMPDERGKDFEREMCSPISHEYFTKDNWRSLFFNRFWDAFSEYKTDID